MDARRDESIEQEVAVDPVRPPLFVRLWPKVNLSPINQRRWANFKANRRGYWSLILFLVLFVVTLFAELIANDRPLIARYKGETLFPALVDYPESKFGGFLAVTDYRDPIIIEEIEANGWMLWPPIRYSYDTINKDYPNRVDAEGRCFIERDGVKQQGGLG
ncbi:MAG: ABC transporter permease, partial [Hyphomicrobium sp.]